MSKQYDYIITSDFELVKEKVKDGYEIYQMTSFNNQLQFLLRSEVNNSDVKIDIE